MSKEVQAEQNAARLMLSESIQGIIYKDCKYVEALHSTLRCVCHVDTCPLIESGIVTEERVQVALGLPD